MVVIDLEDCVCVIGRGIGDGWIDGWIDGWMDGRVW